MDQTTSNAINTAKFFAILSVAFAHAGGYGDPLASNIGTLIGLCGVPVFLFLSGYLCNVQRAPRDFWRKTAERIIVPWLIWGVVTYLIKIRLSIGAFSVAQMLRWIVGYQTWLYYVPVLLICLLLGRLAGNHRMVNLLFFVLSLLSWVLTKNAIIIGSSLNRYLTDYMNALNFLWMFLAGRFVRIREIELRTVMAQRPMVMIGCCFAAAGLGTAYLFLLNERIWISYWGSYLSIPFMIISAWLVLQLAWCANRCGYLREIGEQSYILYFIHMPIASRLLNYLLFQRLSALPRAFDFVLLVVKPLFIIAVSALIAFAIRHVLKKCKFERFGRYLGIV